MKAIKIIFISALLAAQAVFAGPNVIGNGGNGVFLENKFYVLDLVESDSHTQPFFIDSASQYYYDRLKYALNAFNDQALVNLVARKIMEIGALDLLYTESLIRTFEAVRWNLVEYHLNLMPVISPVAAEQYQIAIRTSDNILIDRYYWNLLNLEHRVALLFHEANFILIRPSETAADDDLQKSAFQSRLLTGYIFSKSMGEEYKASFARRLHPLFPSVLSEIDGQKVFAIYRTKVLSAYAAEDVITVNPYLQLSFKTSKIDMNLYQASQDDVIAAICKQQELPTAVQLFTHVVYLELYKGDNNKQDYLFYPSAADEGFPELKPLKATCVSQVTKFYHDLVRHID